MFKTIDTWLMNLSAKILAWARASNEVSYKEFVVIKKNHDDALNERNKWLASRGKNGK